MVWGAKPKKINAHYTTADGTSKTSLLLASGAAPCHLHPTAADTCSRSAFCAPHYAMDCSVWCTANWYLNMVLAHTGLDALPR